MPRDNKGRYQPATTAEEILESIPEDTPTSTRDVADAVGVSRRTTLRYLDELAETEEVNKIKIDDRRAIWVRTR